MGEPISVLVAEDDHSFRAALAEFISTQDGLRLVGAAQNATEAILLAAEHQPDVALIDSRMPAGGGAKAVRSIGRCSSSTKCIALSAYDDRQIVLDMLAAGAVGYLVKGVRSERIVEAIRLAMKGYAILSPEVAVEVIGELAKHLAPDELASRPEIVRATST